MRKEFGLIQKRTLHCSQEQILREGLINPANTASEVWADTAFRSTANESFLARAGKVSRINHKKPNGRPMLKLLPGATRRVFQAQTKLNGQFPEASRFFNRASSTISSGCRCR